MNVKTLLVASGIMFSMTTLAQSSFSFTTPPQVESVLNLSGDNKNELKTVLNYYAQKHDSLKWKAACFLIGNMDIHFSEQFYWETHEGKVQRTGLSRFSFCCSRIQPYVYSETSTSKKSDRTGYTNHNCGFIDKKHRFII